MDQSESSKKNYQQLVRDVSPSSKIVTNCIKAFIVGGIICDIGQLINNMLLNSGFSIDVTAMLTSVILIGIAAILTGFGVYDNIGKFAGAGSIVPITGFSNAMVAPALEFKKEGYIFGVGAKLFLIAGPVILYGTVTSIIVGFIYYFVR